MARRQSTSPAGRRDRRQRTPARAWLAAHRECLTASAGRLARRWPSALLTAAVIGITLALPTGLYVVVDNLNALTGHWQRSVAISLYLQDNVDGRQIAARLAENANIAATRYISAKQGLRQFRRASNLGAALDALEDNPLPAVVRVTPKPGTSSAVATRLAQRLGKAPGVARAKLDAAWLARLNAIIDLIGRSAWVIALLLAGAAAFIIGNTIRLDIENRREEIEVMKLLGAPDAFIRRPFLYTGVWYGLAGGLAALAILAACFFALRAPLAALENAYGGSLAIRSLGLGAVGLLLIAGIALGWLASALAANRRLAAIEPE